MSLFTDQKAKEKLKRLERVSKFIKYQLLSPKKQ